MNFKAKFSLSIFLLVAIVLAGASFFFYLSEKYNISQQFKNSHQNSIRRLAKVCEESVLAKEDLVAINYIRELSVSPEILSAIFADRSGEIRAATDSLVIGSTSTESAACAAGGNSGPKVRTYTAPGGAELMEYCTPVVSGGNLLGTAAILYKSDVIKTSTAKVLRESLIRFLKWAVLGSLLLGIVVGMVFAAWLTKPIERLVEGARSIGEGQLDHRIQIANKDEIGRLAQEFNQMAERLSELDSMKQEFINSMTHDLRNPLAGIRGYAEMMKNGRTGPLTERQNKYLDTILSSVLVLGEMIDDVLDLAKLDAGMMTLNLTTIDLSALAGDIVKMFEAAAEKEKIRLSLDAQQVSALPADEGLIRRLISNLISNSLKFTPDEGSITVIIREEANGFVRCSVNDTGPGIPKESLGRMFKKFEQIQNRAVTRKVKGTGLGLAICKVTAEAHGGEIGVLSEEGKGSSFFFTLPVNPEKKPA